MHSKIAEVSLATIKSRIAEGDCPTIKPYSVEVLEELVVHFATPTQPTATTTEVSEAMVEALALLRKLRPAVNAGGSVLERKALSEFLSRYAALSPGDGVPGMVLGGAIADITAERRRQIEEEGWTPKHDDAHASGELRDAAACYATSKEITCQGKPVWPWWNSNFDSAGYELSRTKAWWKPKGARRDLVRAGALIAAEIDRLDRLSTASSTGKETPEPNFLEPIPDASGYRGKAP